jgi:hypothetical protein
MNGPIKQFYYGVSSKDILTFSDVVTYNLVDGKSRKNET